MAEDDQAEGGGKGKMLLLVIIGLLLVLISVGGTVGVLMLFKEEPEMAATDEMDAGEMPAEEEVKLPAIYFPLKPPLLLTYSDRGRQRYAQIDLTLMTRSEAVVKEVELHSSRIRNDLIMAFSGLEFNEVQTAEGKELMRQQALDRVQQILQEEMGEPGVEQVLFTNLVMQ
ncbi:flagellar basal body-associated FliL family protein [Halioxenophilus sp. WMMB6]|uniref:flagellar basal body-associated FliL family protein n=1 Tax=Halioxenophilus sp. WMMB6 TaxID=3073815 RepID=UPI00295EB155|nr:flagellar basal body-associated FliL family protein [Halioxenophilus sp. WMMB6]